MIPYESLPVLVSNKCIVFRESNSETNYLSMNLASGLIIKIIERDDVPELDSLKTIHLFVIFSCDNVVEKIFAKYGSKADMMVEDLSFSPGGDKNVIVGPFIEDYLNIVVLNTNLFQNMVYFVSCP